MPSLDVRTFAPAPMCGNGMGCVHSSALKLSLGRGGDLGSDAYLSNLPSILGLANPLEAIVEFGMIHAYVRK
jgi:hypothetical protein